MYTRTSRGWSSTAGIELLSYRFHILIHHPDFLLVSKSFPSSSVTFVRDMMNTDDKINIEVSFQIVGNISYT